MDLQGPDFSDSRDPMIIFADSGATFHGRYGSLKRLLKKPGYRGAFQHISWKQDPNNLKLLIIF